MPLSPSECGALYDALYAWRDLLWARCLADRRCEFWLWSGILSRHWEATR
jgi:hypothetical protein